MMDMRNSFFQPEEQKYAEWRQTAEKASSRSRVQFRALSEKESTCSALLIRVVRPRKRVTANQSARSAKEGTAFEFKRQAQAIPASHACRDGSLC